MLVSVGSVAQVKKELKGVLENINKFKKVSYKSTNFFCYPGDTVPMTGEKVNEFYLEYYMPLDTMVGAAYAKFDWSDTTKVLIGYDGNKQYKIDWEEYAFFKRDYYPNSFPFFARSRAVIEYVLNTNDSVVVDREVDSRFIAYHISIFNERIEFAARFPCYINEPGSNIGVVSEYTLWVNRKTWLPYKFKRTLPGNTIIDEISQLKNSTEDPGEFNMDDYIPEDMKLWVGNSRDTLNFSDKILNTVVHNWHLCDINKQYHNLNEESSKVYMIGCTSLFCGPCKRSVPFLKELYSLYSNKDFSFVSLYKEEERKGVIHYVKDKDIRFDILLAPQSTFDSLQVSFTPTFIFLDEEKRVKRIIYGFTPGKTETEIKETIKELL